MIDMDDDFGDPLRRLPGADGGDHGLDLQLVERTQLVGRILTQRGEVGVDHGVQ